MINILPDHLWGFCGNALERREYMRNPMRHNDSAILTNGAIIIRIWTVAPGLLANMADFPHVNFPKKIDDAATALGGALAPLPQLPVPIPCNYCSGSRFQKICPDCNERGCVRCANSGMIPTSSDDSEAEPCWYCDGIGHARQEIDIGLATFDTRLLALIGQLDDALFAPDDAENAGYFRCAIGDGLLMPMRKESA